MYILLAVRPAIISQLRSCHVLQQLTVTLFHLLIKCNSVTTLSESVG